MSGSGSIFDSKAADTSYSKYDELKDAIANIISAINLLPDSNQMTEEDWINLFTLQYLKDSNNLADQTQYAKLLTTLESSQNILKQHIEKLLQRLQFFKEITRLLSLPDGVIIAALRTVVEKYEKRAKGIQSITLDDIHVILSDLMPSSLEYKKMTQRLSSIISALMSTKYSTLQVMQTMMGFYGILTMKQQQTSQLSADQKTQDTSKMSPSDDADKTPEEMLQELRQEKVNICAPKMQVSNEFKESDFKLLKNIRSVMEEARNEREKQDQEAMQKMALQAIQSKKIDEFEKSASRDIIIIDAKLKEMKLYYARELTKKIGEYALDVWIQVIRGTHGDPQKIAEWVLENELPDSSRYAEVNQLKQTSTSFKLLVEQYKITNDLQKHLLTPDTKAYIKLNNLARDIENNPKKIDTLKQNCGNFIMRAINWVLRQVSSYGRSLGHEVYEDVIHQPIKNIKNATLFSPKAKQSPQAPEAPKQGNPDKKI